MNAAGAFGLLLVLVWLVRARPKEATAQPQGLDRRDAWIFLGIALLVAAAYARVARSYFLTDDFVLLLHADDFRRGILWTFTHGGGDGFFRPFFYLTFGAVEQIAHRNPLAWHAIELAIHTANCWMVYLLAGALGWSRFSACAAAALFAIHGTRPEAVVGINAQPDLLAALFTLITLVLFLRNRRWLALAAMILGLLSKEPAYSTPLLLTIIAYPRFKQTIPYWLAAGRIHKPGWYSGIPGTLRHRKRTRIEAMGRAVRSGQLEHPSGLVFPAIVRRLRRGPADFSANGVSAPAHWDSRGASVGGRASGVLASGDRIGPRQGAQRLPAIGRILPASGDHSRPPLGCIRNRHGVQRRRART